MINIARPRVALERLNMELLIYPPRPKRYSRSSSQKERAPLLPASLFTQTSQYLRHLTNAGAAHIFPLVRPTVHIEMPLNGNFPTNEAGFGLNCCWVPLHPHFLTGV